MEDTEILRLFTVRSERAIAAANEKYGAACLNLAERMLGSPQDAEECLNDALLAAWNAIPPEMPEQLGAYLSVLTRNRALNRIKQRSSQRNGGGQSPAVLDELADCVPDFETVDAQLDERLFLTQLETFLDTLKRDARIIFVKRYFYLYPCKEIAASLHISEVKVRVTLSRIRKKLKAFLEKEDAE